MTLSTMRLACSSTSQSGVGTGFLYTFNIKVEINETTDSYAIPVIITNKHVVTGYDTLTTTLTLVPMDSEIDDSLSVSMESYQRFTLHNLQDSLIYHPDRDIDLAIFPLMQLIRGIPEGKKLKMFSLDEHVLLPEQDHKLIRAIEPIAMVGYPNGLWDETNNRPITRKGITASHALHSWNGKRQFVIDAACFPGSSGSPVFFFEDGVARSVDGKVYFGTRACLIGILFAGPLISQEGRIEQRTIPTGTSYVSVTQNMMNLGFVVHAEALNDFIPHLEEVVRYQKTPQR